MRCKHDFNKTEQCIKCGRKFWDCVDKHGVMR